MQNNIKVLLGLLIVIAGLAYWVTQDPTSVDSEQHQMLIPSWQGNDAQVMAIDKIVLNQGQERLSLIKEGEMWRIKDGFYASPEPLFQLIQSLRSAEIKELKTANPAKHDQLELAADDLSVHVYQAEQLLQAIHIGKKSASGLTFVRRVDENQTYAVVGVESPLISVDNWLLKTVLDVDSQEVVAVTIKPSEGEPVDVSRNIETGVLELTNIPAGYQLKTNSSLEQVMGGMSRLMIDEAMLLAASPLALSEVNEPMVLLSTSFQLNSGSTVKLELYKIDESYYMTINSELYPQYQGWVMKIAEYKFNAVNRQLSDFIEPVPETMEENEATEAAVE